MVTDIYTKNYLAYLATYWTKKNNLLCSFLKYRVSFLHIHSMIYLYTSVVVMYSYIFKWTAPNYICVRWIVQRTLCRVLLNRRKRLWQWEGGVYIKSKLPDMHLLPPYCVFDFLYLGTRCDQNDTNDQYCLCHLRLVPFVVITMYIVVERSKVNPVRNKWKVRLDDSKNCCQNVWLYVVGVGCWVPTSSANCDNTCILQLIK